MPLIVKCNNGVVTDTYLEILGEVLECKKQKVRYTNKFKEALKEEKKEIIVVARTIEAFQLLMRGYKNVIVWYQGIEPEESYMSHHSKARYWVLSLMEKFILKRNSFSVFVSEKMRFHYEQKYRITFDSDKYYCMPCMNTKIHEAVFSTTEKYDKNIFAYIGSLAVWQKFNETVAVYKDIEDSGLPNCKLKVFTPQREEAEKILRDYEVNNYEIGFVKNEDLPKALADVKYGFIIREDNLVNRVATPTKISTYLSCGLIPIYSECLSDFSSVARNMKYAFKCNKDIVEEICSFAEQRIDYNDVLNEYKTLFNSHYSRAYHVEQLLSYTRFGKVD